MFDFFKKNTKPDAKGIREALMKMVKEQLQELDGGEGRSLQTVSLYINPSDEDQHLYEAAIYSGENERLREDIQRMADNYALDLPEAWELLIFFQRDFPVGAAASTEVNAAMKLTMAGKKVVANTGRAMLRILKGDAEHETYELSALASRRINIGREAKAEANDGSIRVNHIAFPADPAFSNNKYISRQHAHIEWDDQSASFKLYADEGGIPPGNKTKIRFAQDESVFKLNSSEIGYPLKNADQIILGDAAILEFTYKEDLI